MDILLNKLREDTQVQGHCTAVLVRLHYGELSLTLFSLRTKMSRESKSIGKLRARSCLTLIAIQIKKLYKKSLTLLILQCLTDREKKSSPLTSVAENSSWKQPLCISLSPSVLLSSSWDGSYFEVNERRE